MSTPDTAFAIGFSTPGKRDRLGVEGSGTFGPDVRPIMPQEEPIEMQPDDEIDPSAVYVIREIGRIDCE